ncbi:TIM barrel protein [Pseudomonas sp. RIT-PI-AD]|uniref:hydroxypyruvate isomerase family protein n=1 Tax=Pseudomonas sp. RIT-PI-AD TaxID=3035294 RepID=UPI0021DA1235|nr:TIM barrel protein [Pseudomonas sp. RIT-PI-AD]
MKLSANLSLLFGERPLLQRVVAARAAGFDGVEIQFPYELPALRLKEALEAAGLPLVLINLPAGDFMTGGPGLAANPRQRAAFAAALDEAATYAAMTRPLCVNLLAGRLEPGGDAQEALACLTENLREAARTFAPLGIPVLCEAINSVDMPGFLVNTAEQLATVLDRVDHPNCLAQLDLYHVARQGLDPQDAIRRLAGRIGHVQFADCPGRGAPGSGELDFPALLHALRDSGYEGWLGAEYLPGRRTEDTLGWLADWRR